MIDVLFVCVLGSVTKEIKVDYRDTRAGKDCRAMIDSKVVGSAQHNREFCSGLASKIKIDMEKKGFACNEKVSSKPI